MNTVCIIAIILFVYGLIGLFVGIMVDVLDTKVIIACVFFWAIMIPMYAVIGLIKIVRSIK